MDHWFVKDSDILTNFWKGDALRDLLDETANHGFYRDQRGDTIFDFRGLADGLERRHAPIFSPDHIKIPQLTCPDTVIQ